MFPSVVRYVASEKKLYVYQDGLINCYTEDGLFIRNYEIPYLVDDFVNGAYICRSQFESPEVDGEIIVTSKEPLRIGDMVKVRITAADEYDLTAETI